MMLGKDSGYILEVELIGYVNSLYVRAELFPFRAWVDGYRFLVKWVRLGRGVGFGEKFIVRFDYFIFIDVSHQLDRQI